MSMIVSIIIKNLFQRDSKTVEFIRFVFAGVVATGLHYCIYLILSEYLPTNIAYTLGYIISFAANFFLSNYFTFKTKPSLKKGIGFGVSHLINYTLHIILLNFFIWLGISKQLAPIPVFGISIPVNFFMVRTVFKSRHL